MLWTSSRLHDLVHTQLRGRRLVVVSNREPYLHTYAGARVVCEQPASGMASGLDPVLQACGGVWVAHGSGAAGRCVVDPTDCVPVPPHRPRYMLKRVWLTQEEEAGYYDGFANTGLWPLCHVVFTRPHFAASDWAAYVRVADIARVLSRLVGKLSAAGIAERRWSTATEHRTARRMATSSCYYLGGTPLC